MLSWKPNWAQTRERMLGWWHHEDLVVFLGGPADPQHAPEPVSAPPPKTSIEEMYCDAEWRAAYNHYQLAQHRYDSEELPIADIMLGPGSLALYMGSEPGFSKDTIWFHETIEHVEHPEALPPLVFEQNHWWDVTLALCEKSKELAWGKYLVGIPDLVENIDIIAALRRPQQLLIDMIERPDWVLQKVDEINQIWFEAYDRIYEIIKEEDGSSSWGAFGIWGPGKIAKVQCDTAAMFSPRMFKKFVVPALTEQCRWLDYSMFHLDGPESMVQLDALLAIDELDAIEWTPGAGKPGGADPGWFDMYRKILDAGKSLQIVDLQPGEIISVLDKFGGKGLFFIASTNDPQEYERVMKEVEPYYAS